MLFNNLIAVNCTSEKNILYTIFFAAIAAMLLTVTSCGKNDPVVPVEPPEAWINASLSESYLSFGKEDETLSVAYTINGSAPEAADVEVSVKGGEGVATCKITPDKSGKGGLITFSLISEKYFREQVRVLFSNGKKTVSLPLDLIREDFNFGDGSVAKTFKFKEYARFFQCALSKAEEAVTASVPEDVDWIHIHGPATAVESDGIERTGFSIDLDKNEGDTERHAVITIRKEGVAQELSIEISQIGAQMEGSLERGLIELYKAMDGDNWTGTIWNSIEQREVPANENWCSDKPLLEWAGVSPAAIMYDNDGSNKRYKGTDDRWSLEISSGAYDKKTGPYKVPEEFWRNISSFYSLDLRDNNLEGNIPDGLWNVNLAELWLGGNPGLEGRMGGGIYTMTKLRYFSIYGTKVKGTLSSDISNLTNLIWFDIDCCEFEGTIPEEFGMLPLMYWNFENNYFTELPQFIRYRAKYGAADEWNFWMESSFPSDYVHTQRNKYGQRYCFPYPEWAHIKYGIPHWRYSPAGESKNPETAYTDDLQYPANEYYWDGKDWRHPNLEYPAREYLFDGKEWVHDASCPWDKEYLDPRLADKEHGDYDDPNDPIYYSWAKALKKEERTGLVHRR